MKSKIVVIVLSCLFSLLLVVGLLGVNPADRYAYAVSDRCDLCEQVPFADDQPHTCPLMKITREQKRAAAELLKDAPVAPIDEQIQRQLEGGDTLGASLSLLSHIQYTPSERNQNPNCGNCWVWAGTGVLEVALHVQRGIKDRLSIQYFNSNYNNGTAGSFACCGGFPWDFVTFYNSKKKVIPWSNANASFQDAGRTCAMGTARDRSTISESPSYAITSIGPAQLISTHGVGDTTPITNIKNILNQNKAVFFAFYLANTGDWDQFGNFWYTQAESVLWPNSFSCGEYYDDENGAAGHAVLCVGYEDLTGTANDCWVMLNSWGAPSGRPNALFRIPMHYDYNCADSDGYYNTAWWTIPVTFAGCGDLPPAPTLSSPADGANVAGTSIDFQWNAAACATRYTLQVRNASNNVVFKKAVLGNVTSYTMSGFPNNGTQYKWRVKAGNATVWGPWSGYRNLTNGGGTTTPSAPTLSSPADGANVAGTSIGFQWNATADATKYKLQVRNSSTNLVFKKAELGNVTSHTMSGFPNNGTQYKWRVRAGNAAGWGPWSGYRNLTNGP